MPPGSASRPGNAAFLRGSASALESNRAIVSVLRRAADKAGLPEDAVALVEDTSHETAVDFMRLRGLIDCLIPRGGPGLIASMLENATVPYVLDGDGNCHVYVDAAADLAMALDIVLNAKTHRFGVCNAAETIVVHAAVAESFLPAMAEALTRAGVELRGDERVRAIVKETDGIFVKMATKTTTPPSSWRRSWPWPWSTTWTAPLHTSPVTARGIPKRSSRPTSAPPTVSWPKSMRRRCW